VTSAVVKSQQCSTVQNSKIYISPEVLAIKRMKYTPR